MCRAAATARCWQRPPRPARSGRRTTVSPPCTCRSASPTASSWQMRLAAASASPASRSFARAVRSPRTAAARTTASSASSTEPTSRRGRPGVSSRPEASTAESSRGTSEIMSASTLAPANRPARRPPFTWESAMRSRLRRSMSSPSRSDRSNSAPSSASPTPGAGISRSADAPPDTSSSTRLPGGVAAANSSSARPAARLRSPGRGWSPCSTCMPWRCASACELRAVRSHHEPALEPLPERVRRAQHHRGRGLADGESTDGARSLAACECRTYPATPVYGGESDAKQVEQKLTARVGKGAGHGGRIRWRARCGRPAGREGAGPAGRPSARARRARGTRG